MPDRRSDAEDVFSPAKKNGNENSQAPRPRSCAGLNDSPKPCGPETAHGSVRRFDLPDGSYNLQDASVAHLKTRSSGSSVPSSDGMESSRPGNELATFFQQEQPEKPESFPVPQGAAVRPARSPASAVALRRNNMSLNGSNSTSAAKNRGLGIEGIAARKDDARKANRNYFQPRKSKSGYFRLQNRRYLGNKYKLLGFIEDIVSEKCGPISSFCDIFAGTGAVCERFNDSEIKIISNDFLSANYTCLRAFLGVSGSREKNISEKIEHLNALPNGESNYFSEKFGGTYFSEENARKIGAVREEIENIAENMDEKHILVCSLLYATDKVANTVGHYDAFRKKLDTFQPVTLLIPDIDYPRNTNNRVCKEDANALVRKISCDVLYVDPPYNSRQYSDTYHLLENLAEWKKPEVTGIARKMDRSHIKSEYCSKGAGQAFADLVENAYCKHLLLSYNNTGDSKDGRSNARISDHEILEILREKGNVEIFEKTYKAFTTGKSDGENNVERVFYCKVKGQS